jgi:hypothetical protein
MEIQLFFTIALIFLLTLLGGAIHGLTRDRCLRSFRGFHVTLVKTNGRVVWGRMHLERTGMELVYPASALEDDPPKASYLLHAAEYPQIQTIFRYADNLDEAERKRRDADIATSFHPGPLRTGGRWLRNALGSATDTLRDVLSLVVGRVQTAGKDYVAAEGTDTLKKLGGNVLADVGSTYDPLLERHIGRQVVVEVMEGDEVHEHVGIFKEYSPDFIQLLDVQYPWQRALEVPPDGTAEFNCVSAVHGGQTLKVSNLGEQPILVLSVMIGDHDREVNAIVDAGGAIELRLKSQQEGAAKIHVQTIRELDLIAPRSRCVIRHRAERVVAASLADSMWDVVFDLGTIVRRGEARDILEAKLRKDLEESPDDAMAAASLGGLLVKRHHFAEAEKWLRAALARQEMLPDGGRRVRMQLRELQRRSGRRSLVGRTERPAG